MDCDVARCAPRNYGDESLKTLLSRCNIYLWQSILIPSARDVAIHFQILDKNTNQLLRIQLHTQIVQHILNHLRQIIFRLPIPLLARFAIIN